MKLLTCSDCIILLKICRFKFHGDNILLNFNLCGEMQNDCKCRQCTSITSKF